MMDRRFGNQVKPAPSFAPVRPPLVQRKCACGGSSGLAECSECSKKGKGTKPLTAATSSPGHNTTSAVHASFETDSGQAAQTMRGHDFSRVRIHSEPNGADGIFINGPDKETPKKPATPPPAPKTKTPPAKASCPNDIQVINIEPLTDPQFGKNGMLTGIGAVAYMQVSGPGQTFWDGTKIQETVKQTKNTCGARARKVCSNESGENVDFVVGAATKVLGTKKDALANTFYDLHMFALGGVSVLHEKGLSSCEIECQQSYQCAGKKFGPEFTITYTATRDTIAGTYDVTRIKVDKNAKATPAAAPANP